MLLVFPDEGLLYLLRRMAGNATDATAGLVWALYTNNVTPDRSTILADLTVDTADFGTVQLDQTSLPTQGIASDTGSISGPAITFTNGGSGSVDCYGYCIMDSGQTMLVAAAIFDTVPVTVAPAGVLPVTPILMNRSQEP